MGNYLFDYWPMIRRPKLELPAGAQLAFYIGLNVEYCEMGPPGITILPSTISFDPDPANYGWRDYGPRVGIWRMMDILDKYSLRASVLLNADVCEYYPEIVEEGNKRRWAWLAHGKNNTVMEAVLSPEEEGPYLADVVDVIERCTGRRPRGWLGPALTESYSTANILAGLGVDYILDWCNDDQPYPMKVDQGRMISVPYSIEVNDVTAFVSRGMNAWDFQQMVIDQFDTLYKEGAETGQVMALCLHPFVMTQPFRAKYLERILDHVTNHQNVWLTTSDEIADWYYQNYYQGAKAQIERDAVGAGDVG